MNLKKYPKINKYKNEPKNKGYYSINKTRHCRVKCQTSNVNV